MRKSVERGLIIILAGIVLGTVGNLASPRGISFITPPKQIPKAEEYLSLEKAKSFWESGTSVFLDAREPEDYKAGHIGNALNLPVMAFEKHFGEVAPMLTPESKIVVYCDRTECELSHQLASQLKQTGYTNIHMLFNGWTAWREAGLPTAQGSTP
ncbi:MAG: rhodanese-like domain-containing protein [Pedosphaera sp.]|nr:rhodanese-like domain-containing protein [Pedosphaera sp.]